MSRQLALARLADDECRWRRHDADLAGYAEWPDTGDDDGADWSDLARRCQAAVSPSTDVV